MCVCVCGGGDLCFYEIYWHRSVIPSLILNEGWDSEVIVMAFKCAEIEKWGGYGGMGFVL